MHLVYTLTNMISNSGLDKSIGLLWIEFDVVALSPISLVFMGEFRCDFFLKTNQSDDKMKQKKNKQHVGDTLNYNSNCQTNFALQTKVIESHESDSTNITFDLL